MILKHRDHRELRVEQWFGLPPEGVFPFFADAMNLERITPPWLRFEVLTPPPIDMHEGTLIDYRLRVHAVPIRWRTRITVWQPPFRFVDEQIRGPYRLWRHEHAFEEHEGGTIMRDTVQFRAPLGWLTHPLLVDRDVRAIFEYRRETLRTIFDLSPDPPRLVSGT